MMNKAYQRIRTSLAVCALSAALTACGDYLDEDSADLLIPGTVTEFSPILLGEAYPDQFASLIGFAQLMTDDVEMGPLYYDPRQFSWGGPTEGIDPLGDNGQYAYVWQDDYQPYLTDNFWAVRYANILACNTVIDALPSMKYEPGQEPLVSKLAMQAYTLRAYHYFCLVNTYAKPWSHENLSEPGVVLRTSPDVAPDAKARATIGEVYNQINSDLRQAQLCISSADRQYSKFEITPAAVYFLAARIALFQEDWDSAIAAANNLLALGSHNLTDLNSIGEDVLGRPHLTSDMATYSPNDINSQEVIFAFGRKDNTNTPYISPNMFNYELGFHTSWTGDGSLINQYADDDLRRLAYFAQPLIEYTDSWGWSSYYGGQYKSLKYDNRLNSTNVSTQAWRLPEVYLTLAEAYARKSTSVSTEAVQLLSQLRQKKCRAGSSEAQVQASQFASQSQLVQFIWQERRRELCFDELIRLWDLRRQGCPALTHTLYDADGTTTRTYRLPAQSPNYVLSIPVSETNYNDAVTANRREAVAAQ